MSRRNRERKARKLAEHKEMRDELQQRYRLETAGTRRLVARWSMLIGGLAVVAGLVAGSVWGVKKIAGIKNIIGPWGTVSRVELAASRFVTLETSEGDIKIELDDKKTPNTAANFVALAKKSFYDGIKFHRVIKDFMIQAGDPLSKNDNPADDGTGGPGYQFNDEKITGNYDRGVVAMANSGPDTNGSQFFIMHADNPNMPKSYVIFGKVVEGMDVVDKIADIPVEDNGQGETSRPKTPVVINKVTLSSE